MRDIEETLYDLHTAIEQADQATHRVGCMMDACRDLVALVAAPGNELTVRARHALRRAQRRLEGHDGTP